MEKKDLENKENIDNFEIVDEFLRNNPDMHRYLMGLLNSSSAIAENGKMPSKDFDNSAISRDAGISVGDLNPEVLERLSDFLEKWSKANKSEDFDNSVISRDAGKPDMSRGMKEYIKSGDVEDFMAKLGMGSPDKPEGNRKQYIDPKDIERLISEVGIKKGIKKPKIDI